MFSIGVNYKSTRNTVGRFSDHFNVSQSSDDDKVPTSEQFSISAFLQLYEEHSLEQMTEIYSNRQRTSTKSGILKSEAVLLFARALSEFGVEYRQDIDKVLENQEFEAAIQKIPGQRSGTSLKYFFMLAGSDNHVKPDRMLHHFVYDATGKTFTNEEIVQAITRATAILKQDFPNITPKLLDHAIWNNQRSGK